ncbi:MAG: uracil-DNA glycosylase [Elusimicrobia bacterium]|nr:uracil-DNA glycosylase [Elusimicrobiota bacterium]MBD3411675.1 uracil-DNA glycosylase [Elusimicrobiota bacterium]
MKQKMLNRLRRRMAGKKLPLKKNARHLVFGEGNPDAMLMLIGEAPGRQEDIRGRPFIGSAGKELNRLLASASFKRETIYITSILKYRPPRNRSPRYREIAAHLPYLKRQIEIIKPSVVMPLGRCATSTVLNLVAGMKKSAVLRMIQSHGSSYNISAAGRNIIVIPTYHPAAILYNRRLFAAIKNDFTRVKHLMSRS